MPVDGFVYVIESPSPEDLLDGRTEGNVLIDALRLAGIPYWYSLSVNKSMLLKALSDRLLEAWKFHNKIPIIHLSMHGNTNGVELSSKEFLSWHELRQVLIPLNGAGVRH